MKAFAVAFALAALLSFAATASAVPIYYTYPGTGAYASYNANYYVQQPVPATGVSLNYGSSDFAFYAGYYSGPYTYYNYPPYYYNYNPYYYNYQPYNYNYNPYYYNYQPYYYNYNPYYY